MRAGYRIAIMAVLGLLLLDILLLALLLGPTDIPLSAVVRVLLGHVPGLGSLDDGVKPAWAIIVWEIRLPVVLMALLVGAGLACSGATMQGLFRNPLVDPFIIGISAGGAFGAILGNIVTTELGMDLLLGRIIVVLLSFGGSIITVFLAYLISKTGNRISISNMLLAGIALSAFLTAATQLLTYFFIDNPKTVIFSLMGSCANSQWEELAFVAPVILMGSVVLVFFGRDLNAFSAGEDSAKHLGVEVERSKTVLLVLGSLVTAISVPFCGIIAFVGLIIPHIVRLLVGPDHRVLIPGSLIVGAVFLLICDMVSRNAMNWLFDSPVQIPVGMSTALIGGLFFIYLLVVRRWKGR
jgi:iron complex transport system permease protein